MGDTSWPDCGIAPRRPATVRARPACATLVVPYSSRFGWAGQIEVQRHGRLGEGLVPAHEADHLHALVAGLSVHLLLGRLDPPRAEAALDAYPGALISER